jgi:hypothetical protein
MEGSMIVTDGGGLIKEIPSLRRRWIGGGIRCLLAESARGAPQHQERKQNPHSAIIAVVCVNPMSLHLEGSSREKANREAEAAPTVIMNKVPGDIVPLHVEYTHRGILVKT